mmetsp:Transcript_44532/g.89953  ORF Transcript_44532/g.89953 Transcript_44532/m.89953 type:complete len:240 (+) Transcript_44532:719-1438(+)
MVVPRGISEVMTPPLVSMPSESGATSRRSTSIAAPSASPLKIPACTAAPNATASSGLIPRFSSLPSKKEDRSCCTRGIRVDPPTSTTSSTCPLLIFASLRTCATGASVFLNRFALISSNLARVTVWLRSSPSASASISTQVEVWLDKLRFATSHCRRRRCRARLLLRTESPSPGCFLSNTLMRWSMRRWSKSSPPKWVSPAVALTSNTPLSMVSSVTSKVPPPKSNTNTVSSLPFFSSP